MNCFMCKGDLENKNTTFMVELDNCIIIIKNVLSQVCKQCGEVSYSNEVVKQPSQSKLIELTIKYHNTTLIRIQLNKSILMGVYTL